jgi:glycosyltransferase involved in cell wall biosynthesis
MIPIVSIIVPNYNHAPFLKQRIDTILNQTFQDFEIIILDDASTDGSLEILKSYKNNYKVSHLILNEVNSGSPFKQWQKGIDLAKGKYLWIAESDDYSDVHFLECCLLKLKNADVCYTQSVDVNAKGEIVKQRIDYTKKFQPNIWEQDFSMIGKQFVTQYMLIKNVIPNASSVVFKKELIQSKIINDIFLNMKMCGDWYFWTSVCLNSKIAFIATPLNYFRTHDAISRQHDSVPKKKQRLLEEAELRFQMFKEYQLRNNSQEYSLFRRWFQIHQLKDIFTSHFYKIKRIDKNNISFALSYLKFNQ